MAPTFAQSFKPHSSGIISACLLRPVLSSHPQSSYCLQHWDIREGFGDFDNRSFRIGFAASKSRSILRL
ncbi:hypothetical protein PAXINDRAFT_22168 [Paxillus involutus ATCC 200175]|uniref:Uncharacterized protein n=1 Tax=Paxillus involutus ATCC 200175 TaxID=664439 RepID=A0A0C9SLJ6_PAXIN|nr:hypothetical protein PAXINDRAFT_22168 [Paxillus involutus ATCC 200175]